MRLREGDVRKFAAQFILDAFLRKCDRMLVQIGIRGFQVSVQGERLRKSGNGEDTAQNQAREDWKEHCAPVRMKEEGMMRLENIFHNYRYTLRSRRQVASLVAAQN